MASEMFAEGGSDIAITLTPGVGGVLQVFVDDEKIYDKSGEGGQYPTLPRVKQMRAVVRAKLAAVGAAADD